MKKSLYYIIMWICILLILSCEHRNYTASDIELWKETEDWELARSISKHDFKKAASILSEDKGNVKCREPKYGETLLHWAVHNQDFQAVKFLIEHGADPNCHDTFDGVSPIAIASDYHIPSEILAYILVHGGNPNDYVDQNEQTSNGRTIKTPLIRAAFTSLEKVKMLINAGGDVNFCVEKGHTPLLYAVMKIKPDVLQYLVYNYNINYNDTYMISSKGDTLDVITLLEDKHNNDESDSIIVRKVIDKIKLSERQPFIAFAQDNKFSAFAKQFDDIDLPFIVEEGNFFVARSKYELPQEDCERFLRVEYVNTDKNILNQTAVYAYGKIEREHYTILLYCVDFSPYADAIAFDTIRVEMAVFDKQGLLLSKKRIGGQDSEDIIYNCVLDKDLNTFIKEIKYVSPPSEEKEIKEYRFKLNSVGEILKIM